MNVLKIVYLLRTILLLILCVILINGKLFIEAGFIALYILTTLTKSKLLDLESRLRKLENNE